MMGHAIWKTGLSFLILLVLVGCDGTEGKKEIAFEGLELGELWSLRVGFEDELDAGAAGSSQPRILSLKPQQEISYFLRVEPGARLSFDRLVRSGEVRSPLRVIVEPDLAEATCVGDYRKAREATSISLESWGGAIVRLKFVFEGQPTGQLEQWSLHGPRIEFPANRTTLEAARESEKDVSHGQPNVLIYLADTLRRASLGTYSSRDQITPLIDAFADRATVYDMARAQSSWTRPSVASIFTGLEPQSHGVHGRKDSLPAEATTLAEHLAAAGYFTGAVITNGNVGPAFGMMQGFDLVSRARHHGRDRSSAATTSRALDFFAASAFREPFFLYVHNLDPHHPFAIVDPARAADYPLDLDPEQLHKRAQKAPKTKVTQEERAALKWLYDEEVSAMDREFGRLVEGVRELGFFEDTVFVFLSDHGEEFWEHSMQGHGSTLYQEVIDIPLIVKAPGQVVGNRVSGVVRQVDLFASIAEYAGVSLTSEIAGRALPTDGEAGDRVSVSILDMEERRKAVSVTNNEWKLIVHGEMGQEKELFHVAADPNETKDLADERPVILGYMQAMLHEVVQSSPELAFEVDDGVVDDELRGQLQALGYLE